MATFSEVQHPIPKGELVFQNFCLKLIRAYWKDDYAQEHGRRGQGQNGVDITGTDNRSDYKNAAVQCKGTESHEPRQLTEDELIAEVEKAKGFIPKLDILIVAYAGKRDAKLQKKAKELNDANKAAGFFNVALWSWDDIVSRAENFPEVAQELLILNGVAPESRQLNPRRPQAGKERALEKLQSAVAEVQVALLADTPKSDADDPVAQAKIDVFRDQILAGDGRAVIQLLRTFVEGLQCDVPPRVRFRAYANLGAALTQCGLFEDAAIAFDGAVDAELDTADGHAYAARAAVIRKQVEKAYKEAEKALGLDNSHRLAATILVEAAPKEIVAATLEKRVAPVVLDANVGWALSHRYSGEGAHDDAIRVARQIEIKNENWMRDLAIGGAILSKFENNFDARIGAPQTEGSAALLSEAKTSLEKGWERIKARSDSKNWMHVAANLCAAYRLAGDDEKADTLALEALTFDPDSDALKERAVLAYLHRNNIDQASKLANQLAELRGSDEAMLAASVAVSSQNWDLVEKWGQKCYGAAKDGVQKARAAELLILAEYRTKDATAALVKADALRPTFAANIAFEARAAEIARRLGDGMAIEAARRRVAAFDPNTLNAIERFELADAYSDDGDWSKAADLLVDLHTNDRPSEVLKRRLYALYRANRRTEARKLYESLHGAALQSKEVRRIGAAIYEISGLLPQALEQLASAIKIDSKDVRSHLDWARLSLRNNNEKLVARWIKKTPLDFHGLPEDMMELAQLLDRYERRNDALKLGYETLRSNWGKSEPLHMKFCSLFLLRGTRIEKFLHPKEVAEDTVVFLEDDKGARMSYRIETGETSFDVLEPTHAFANKLIGAKVGEERTTPPGVGQVQAWKIKEIKHKYIDLFHRALQHHSTLFPGSRALGSFRIDPKKENDFEPIFETVRARTKYAEDVAKLYDENVIPVDVVGKLLGIDAIDAGLGLRFNFSKRIDNCVGGHEERIAAIRSISVAKNVIVDPLTFAIWDEIGFLTVIDSINSLKIEVVQSTLDVLKMRAESARLEAKQKGGVLQAQGDKFVWVEQTAADKKANAIKWEALEEWARSHSSIIATEAIKDISDGHLSEVLTHSSIDTIATATARKKMLMSEDRRLRALAQSIGVESSCWTQPFLMSLLENGKINREKYIELLANLQKSRIGFVSIGSDDLLTAAISARDDAFDALVEALTAPNVEPRGLVNICVQFIKELWLNPSLVMNRSRFINKILYSLILSHPDGVKVFRVIFKLVRDEIRAMPFPFSQLYKQWEELIFGFLRGHFLLNVII